MKPVGSVSQRDKKLWENKALEVLKGPCIDSFPHNLACSKLQWRDSSSKCTRDIQGETELTNFTVRPGEAKVRIIFSRNRSAGMHHCSCVELSSHLAGPVQVGTKSELFIKLANTFHPTLVIFCFLTLLAHPAQVSCGEGKQPASPHDADIPKISQNSKILNQAVVNISIPPISL